MSNKETLKVFNLSDHQVKIYLTSDNKVDYINFIKDKKRNGLFVLFDENGLEKVVRYYKNDYYEETGIFSIWKMMDVRAFKDKYKYNIPNEYQIKYNKNITLQLDNDRLIIYRNDDITVKSIELQKGN